MTDRKLEAQDLEALKALAPGLIALAKAGDALREHYCESAACDMDGGRQQDILLESGVLVATPGGYSLERHGEQHEWGPEEGDDWYVETPSAYTARLQLEAGIIGSLLSHITALEAEKAEARRLADEAAFLLARLAEWENENLTDEGARDWAGHVCPSIERLRIALKDRP